MFVLAEAEQSREEEKNGEIEESHSTQPVPQGPQEWHQEAQAPSAHLHKRGIIFCSFSSYCVEQCVWQNLRVNFFCCCLDGSKVFEESEVREEAQ